MTMAAARAFSLRSPVCFLAMLLAVIAGAVFTFGTIWGGPMLYRVLGGQGDALQAAIKYSNYLFAGAIPVWIVNLQAAALRGSEIGAEVVLKATKVDGGWRLDGRKTFGTLSPVADLMVVSCRCAQDDGMYLGGNAIVFRGTPGNFIREAQVMVKVLGSSFRPLIFHAKTNEEGIAVVHLHLPQFRSGRGAILVRAISDGEEAELRQIVRQS